MSVIFENNKFWKHRFYEREKIDVKKNNTLVEPRGKANLELDRR